MSRKALTPVTVAGIEFDALMDEQKTLSASVPVYPVEDGFPVSDTIILEPLSIQMNLYVSNTPVTWLYRHGSATDRVNKICEQLENLWLEKKLVKVVTTEAIYTDMGITSISIKKSKDIGYAREVAIQMQKVRITQRKTVLVPNYILKSGQTMAEAGSAQTNGSNGSSGDKKEEAKKNQSILYGVASGFGFIS